MKSSLLVLVLLLSNLFVKAQDQIITQSNDTIECKIISLSGQKIHYEQKTAKAKIVGKSIATSNVLEYTRTDNTPIKQLVTPIQKREKPKFPLIISAQTGLSHSLTDYGNFKDIFLSQGTPASNVDNYIKKLKNGYFVGVNSHYMLTKNIGIGADYTLSYFWASDDFLVQGFYGMNIPTYAPLELEEKLIFNYIGPSFLFKQAIGNQHHLNISGTISPGLLFLREEIRSNSYQTFWDNNTLYDGGALHYFNNSNSLSTGNTFAIKGSLAFDFCVTTRLSAGFAANYTWAKLHKLSVKSAEYDNKNQELPKALDISRIDYGFLFRYNF